VKLLKDVPLIGQPFIYTGKDNESHKNGETYHVIETGKHWIKEYGFVIWVTTEEDKHTKDIDYCMSCSIGYFNKNFWKT
jgi:hypothetical protein